MARLNHGILDPINGKVGNVVGYMTRGKGFIRAYQENVRNPRTNAQTSVRLRFSELTKLCSYFSTAINLGMKQYAQQNRITTYNAFSKLNWENVTGDASSGITTDYTALRLAKGNLIKAEFGTASFDDALKVKVAQTDTSAIEGASALDNVYVVVFQPDAKTMFISPAKTRADASIEVAVPAGWSGMTVYVYGFAMGMGSNNYGKVSDSKFIGSGMIV